jgi:hypothetical protein
MSDQPDQQNTSAYVMGFYASTNAPDGSPRFSTKVDLDKWIAQLTEIRDQAVSTTGWLNFQTVRQRKSDKHPTHQLRFSPTRAKEGTRTASDSPKEATTPPTHPPLPPATDDGAQGQRGMENDNLDMGAATDGESELPF